MLVWTCVASHAQQNLAINRFFEQIPQSGVRNQYVCMTGNSIKNYNGINLFKSLVINDSKETLEQIRKEVLVDGKDAVNTKSIAKDGQVRSFYCQLAPEEGSSFNRFILFREMGEGSAMLVYMEGTNNLDDIVNVNLKKK